MIFKVDIEAVEGDFCSPDLEEAIKDGMDNVGNYGIKSLKVVEE